jgi:hypothetical protein
VRVTLHDGLVTVVARDATLRQILAEWARVGQTKLVNGERVTGGPMSLELTNVPEQEALDLLLRSVSGYIAAPRPVAAANLSQYDRIIVMPATAVARPAPGASPPATAPPAAAPQQPPSTPPFAQPAAPSADDGEEERTPQVNRPPVFQSFAQPQVVNPNQPLPTGAAPVQPQPVQQPPQQPAAPPPAAYPTAPFGGVAVPGMVAPTPQPNPPGVVTPPNQVPNQPGVVTQPGQVPSPPPTRRPGGR